MSAERQRKLQPVGHVKIPEYFGQVSLDRALADVELHGDFLVAGTARDELADLSLSRRESQESLVGRPIPRTTVPDARERCEQRVHQSALDPDLPSLECLHGLLQ